MNLYHFEEVVSPIIVDRGFVYYETGYVAKLTHEGDGRYTAFVEGTDLYEIEIQIDDQCNILSSYCDCPYEMGPVCKHEVAVYYELIDELVGNERLDETIFAYEADQPDLKTVLEGLSKEKLVDILIGLANEDPILNHRLLFNYANVDERQEVDRCKMLIDSIVKKYVGRERYITYKYVDDFSDELSNVLERIETLKDPLISIEVAGLLLIEAINSFQYADDSGGRIGYLIDQTIKAMQMIVNEPLEGTVQSELLDKLIHLSENTAFEGWEDYRIDVLSICTAFAGSEPLRRKLIAELESKIDDLTALRYKHYANERIFNLMYTIIQTHGTYEEASQFLRDKVKYASFRERLMQQEMDVGNYDEVIRLAFDGERMDRDYLGLVTGWKKWRYDAYKQLKSPKEQTKLGRELLMEGHFEYYWDLKELALGDYSFFYLQLKQELAVENRMLNASASSIAKNLSRLRELQVIQPGEARGTYIVTIIE